MSLKFVSGISVVLNIKKRIVHKVVSTSEETRIQNCARTDSEHIQTPGCAYQSLFYFLFQAHCCSDICFEGGGVDVGQVVGGGWERNSPG